MSTSRLQLALNVSDLESAASFYSELFGVAPHKSRPGYVNFAIADPPLKLVLFENADAPGTLNHLGVELASTQEVQAATDRFQSRGLDTLVSQQENCCHAIQDKVYVTAPDVPLGQWEFYTVLDEDPDATERGAGATCCTQEAVDGSACCAPA